MAFSIKASGEAEYTIKDSDDTFTTSEVELINEEKSTYQSGPKEQTHEIIGTYRAKSDHGSFIWTTTTTISTFDGYPAIDSELTESPEVVEDINAEPSFETEDEDQ